MEADLQIIVKNVNNDLAKRLGQNVVEMVRGFSEAFPSLDLRRMHRIILTSDFSGELAALSTRTASKNPIHHTNEEYAVAIAKTLLLPLENEIEVMMVLDANWMVALAPHEKTGYESEEFRETLHQFHHEICHVHDENKKLDAIPNVFLKRPYADHKEAITLGLAEQCWSEYIANRLSCTSATESWLSKLTDCFKDGLLRTKTTMNDEIRDYRTHANIEQLLAKMERHGHFLMKTAAYVLGYLDGLEISLIDINREAAKQLAGSYFESIWHLMQVAIRAMYKDYPERWKGLEVFGQLQGAAEEYYRRMGLVLSLTEDRELYIHVPFTLETMPR